MQSYQNQQYTANFNNQFRSDRSAKEKLALAHKSTYDQLPKGNNRAFW